MKFFERVNSDNLKLMYIFRRWKKTFEQKYAPFMFVRFLKCFKEEFSSIIEK